MRGVRTVLITGVCHYWGQSVARFLLATDDYHVIGLDDTPLTEQMNGLDFIQADIRNPLLSELMLEEKVDAVLHLAFKESHEKSESLFEYNVMGTMRVLGAAAEAGVQKAALMSSTMVYGAQPGNSAFLSESHPLNGSKLSASIAHRLEIETFCNGFRLQRPSLQLTSLRFPGIIGPTADTEMTRFLSSPLTPVLFGFDPMMQVVHEKDVIGALVHAVNFDKPGVFNVAASPPLPLSKITGLAGKLSLPVVHLAPYWFNGLLGGVGVPIERMWPLEPDYLRYSWVADTGRMTGVLGFVPSYGAEEALREFAGYVRMKPFRTDGGFVAEEQRLRDTIERRRRERERRALAPITAEHSQAIWTSTDEDET